MISRREILFDIAALGGLAISAFIPAPSRAATLVDDADKAEQRYEEAIALLKRGRWLNLCATKLKELSASAPQDVRYQIALGHTYASQCASLCYSLGSTPKTPATDQEVKRYYDAIDAALAARRSDKARKFDAPPVESSDNSVEPASSGAFSFVTIDDGKPVVMAREEFVAALRRRFEDASSCWKTAVESAVGDEQKCSALEAHVWGLQLFQSIASYSLSRAVPTAFPMEERVKWQEEAKKLAEQLTLLAPDNAQYRVLLAEVTLQPSINAWSKASESKLALYQKAIEKGANDPAVRYRAYQICIHLNPKRLEEAGRLIREIAADQHSNAYAQYRLAGYLAQNEVDNKPVTREDLKKMRAAMNKLVSVITSGTLLATYKPFGNCVAPPSLLKAPFALLQMQGQGAMGEEVVDAATIGVVLARYARSVVERDFFFAKRCSYAILGMGRRLMKVVSSADGAAIDTAPSQHIREMAGELLLSQGYGVLSEIIKTKGDESEYNKIINEQKEFDAYRRQRRAERERQMLGHR